MDGGEESWSVILKMVNGSLYDQSCHLHLIDPYNRDNGCPKK